MSLDARECKMREQKVRRRSRLVKGAHKQQDGLKQSCMTAVGSNGTTYPRDEQYRTASVSDELS